MTNYTAMTTIQKDKGYRLMSCKIIQQITS